MSRPIRLRLFDILDSIHGIELILLNKTYEDYESSVGLQRGVERCLEIVSEATRYVPEATRARAPEIPWSPLRCSATRPAMNIKR